LVVFLILSLAVVRLFSFGRVSYMYAFGKFNTPLLTNASALTPGC
jgi:hypothetical protein